MALLGPIPASWAQSAETVAVSTSPVTRFKGAEIGQIADRLVFRGGIQLSGDHPDFGGLSGLAFLDDKRFVMVTDEGRFVSGSLELENGAPSALSEVEIDVIRNSAGAPLPRKFAQDSEAVEVVIRDGAPIAVRVGFEHLTRVADFDMVDGRPGGAAREIAIPNWLTEQRTNDSIESVCIAPPTSPIAGSTLIITEGHSIVPGSWAATLLGERDRGDLSLAQEGWVNPTDCAFLPDGDLLVLERSFAFLTFTVQIRRIQAEDVRPGAIMNGEVLLRHAGGEVDNFEGLGVRVLPNGETRITIVSDNNFLGIQRSLLLDFTLPN
ncbi:esterase-like activity of phytase family protein [Pelagibacterium luteolum]|uniref:Phytase-like domain-containing protein n=1 Tax=Pelagibacterium luteolum TaxID=440168 RepID=A0A1G7RPN4_9HYPH|nr:esterase-like activity of phytase family protein [Pelagibacterium luteolum]SDG12757.1 hypothetical protein SAMN04487974_10142 [Pelagibacterium luteolum]